MTDDNRKPREAITRLGRRGFLKGSAVAGAATLAAPFAVPGASAAQPAKAPLKPSRLDEGLGPHPDDHSSLSSAGSDYMIDVLRKTGIDHVCFVPGDTFKGLHEFSDQLRHADRAENELLGGQS